MIITLRTEPYNAATDNPLRSIRTQEEMAYYFRLLLGGCDGLSIITNKEYLRIRYRTVKDENAATYEIGTQNCCT